MIVSNKNIYTTLSTCTSNTGDSLLLWKGISSVGLINNLEEKTVQNSLSPSYIPKE